MSEERIPLLVLGLGNVLCGDDGAGVEAVARIHRRWRFADSVRVLDGGTLGLALLPYLRSADQAILVDAVLVDEPVGTIVRFGGDEVFSVAGARMSCHQIGVAEVLECARLLGDLPPVTLIGISVAEVAAMAPPTAAVAGRIDDLARSVVEEIEACGFDATPLRNESNHGEGPLRHAVSADSSDPAHERTGFRDRL